MRTAIIAAVLAVAAPAFAQTQLGAALSATLRTGDVRDELDVGHPMVMPGGWADGRSSPLVSIVYGAMLGGHHHGMVAPVVSPMNSEEVSGGMRAGHRFGRTELAMTANGAIPIGPGLYRGAVVALTPIHARGVFEISRLF